jgi:hypothetical protein
VGVASDAVAGFAGGSDKGAAMTGETPDDRGQHAAFMLGPETNLFADADAAGLGRALGAVFTGAMSNPAEAGEAWLRYTAALAQIPAVALSSWIGRPIPPPVSLDPRDKRFTDPAWSDNPAFYSLRMSYQAFADFTGRLVSAAGLESQQEAKARLISGLVVDALAHDQLPAHQPGRAQAGVRDRWRQRGQGDAQLRRRPAAQQRPAPAG